jgi:hypothetical protein
MWTKPLAGAGIFHPVEPDAASAPTIGMHGVGQPGRHQRTGQLLGTQHAGVSPKQVQAPTYWPAGMDYKTPTPIHADPWEAPNV